MPRIFTSREVLDFGIDEHLAHCENGRLRVLESMSNRTMTRTEYRRANHFVRDFSRRRAMVKHLKYPAFEGPVLEPEWPRVG